MDTQSPCKVEVIALAIDGDNLVLETVIEKNEIRWPLNNLPRPLEIGSRLTLELQKDGLQNHNPSDNFTPKTDHKQGDKDDLMRKLLEDLVN